MGNFDLSKNRSEFLWRSLLISVVIYIIFPLMLYEQEPEDFVWSFFEISDCQIFDWLHSWLTTDMVTVLCWWSFYLCVSSLDSLGEFFVGYFTWVFYLYVLFMNSLPGYLLMDILPEYFYCWICTWDVFTWILITFKVESLIPFGVQGSPFYLGLQPGKYFLSISDMNTILLISHLSFFPFHIPPREFFSHLPLPSHTFLLLPKSSSSFPHLPPTSHILFFLPSPSHTSLYFPYLPPLFLFHFLSLLYSLSHFFIPSLISIPSYPA